MRLWHETRRRLRFRRGEAAMLGAAVTVTRLLCLICAYTVQTKIGHFAAADAAFRPSLTVWDAFVPAALAVSLIALTPLRVQTAWQLGRISGTLDENDLGFLAQCRSIWLWKRALRVRLTVWLTGLCACMPALVLMVAAKTLWLTIPPESESILALLGVLHLAMLAAASMLIPLRICAAATALPFCFLKEPYLPARALFLRAISLTKGQSGAILRMRLVTLPALLIPFSAVAVWPVLLCTEQLRCCHAHRRQQQPSRSRFSRLELHAADGIF